MTDIQDTRMPTTRRALLAAAAGAAAAAAATAVSAVAPATTLAADPNDVVKNVDNATTAVTSISQTTADINAFEASGMGNGVGVMGMTDGQVNAGVVGLAGDVSTSTFVTHGYDLDTGVYGFASQTSVSSGLFGEGPTGVYAVGDFGVYAFGSSVGVFAGANGGTSLHAHTGATQPPAPTANVSLLGTVSTTSQTGLQAYGKVKFPNRSGRVTIASGSASKSVTISGVTSSNYAFAVLNASRSGIYVRAVVPGTNKITIYLNKAVSSSTSIAYVVLG